MNKYIFKDYFLPKHFGKDYLQDATVMGGMVPENLLEKYLDEFYFLKDPNLPSDLGLQLKKIPYTSGKYTYEKFYFDFKTIQGTYRISLYCYVIIPTRQCYKFVIFHDKKGIVKLIVYHPMSRKYPTYYEGNVSDLVPNTFNTFFKKKKFDDIFKAPFHLDAYERIYSKEQLVERAETENMIKEQNLMKQFVRAENKMIEDQRKKMEHEERSMKTFLTEKRWMQEKQLKLLETREHFLKSLPPFIKIVKQHPRYPYYFMTVHDTDDFYDELIQLLKENNMKCSIASDDGDFNFKYSRQKIKATFVLTIFVHSMESLKRLHAILKQDGIEDVNVGYKLSRSIGFNAEDLGITTQKFLFKLPKYINEYKKLNEEQTAMAVRQEKQLFSKGLLEQLKPYKEKSVFRHNLLKQLSQKTLRHTTPKHNITEISRLKLLKDIEKGKNLKSIKIPPQLLEQIRKGTSLKYAKTTDMAVQEWLKQLQNTTSS